MLRTQLVGPPTNDVPAGLIENLILDLGYKMFTIPYKHYQKL
jgi:hypothetical protein